MRATASCKRVGCVVVAVVAENVVRLLAITAVRLGDGGVPESWQRGML